MIRAAFVALALAVAVPARAVVVEPEDGPCPLGGGPVRVFHMVSQNTHGGWDSDGARYSSGGQWRQYAVSTCPGNLLSLYGDDMRQPLTPAQAHELEPVLADLAAHTTDARGLAVWERYAMAARAYEALGRGPLFLARLHVEAAWTARDAGVGYYEGLEGPVAVREVLEAAEEALSAASDDGERRLVLLNLARVAHRGGYGAERDAWLARLDARADLTDEDRYGMERLRAAARAEAALQDVAIEHLRAFLADASAGTATERVEATFLLGDLLRRRDRSAEALVRYDAVVATEDAPEPLVALARYLAAEIRGEPPAAGAMSPW